MLAITFWFVEVAALASIATGFVILVRRNQATASDIAVIIAPFVLWLALALLNLSPKTLSNLIEPLVLLPLIAVIFAVRTFIKTDIPQATKARFAFLSALIVAILLYFLVPALPE